MSQPIHEIVSLADQLGIIAHFVTRLEESSFASKVYRIDTANEKKVLKLHHGSLGGAWADIVRDRMGEDFVRRCCDRLQELSAMFSDQDPTCLIHCDFRFGNILKRRDGKLSVIDFESSREGDAAYDFIKIWEDLGNSQETTEWQSFLDGYGLVRPVPANLGSKIAYYWFDLNFGFLYWAIDRGDESLFQSRLRIVNGLLTSA